MGIEFFAEALDEICSRSPAGLSGAAGLLSKPG
jgi:hypothetical protein